MVGSHAAGTADPCSDVEVALVVPGDVGPAIARRTERIHADLGALHHRDLPASGM